MHFAKFQDRRTGFVATAEPGDAFPFHRAGEIWAPQRWSIQSHQHENWELYLQITGDSVWKIGRKHVEVPQHAAYLIKPGVKHHLLHFKSEPNHFFFCDFSPSLITESMQSLDCWKQDHSILPDASLLILPFQGLIQELAHFGSNSQHSCKAYLTVLCHQVTRLSSQEHQTPESIAHHPAVHRAITLMQQRLDYPWTLDELSRLSWVSPSHLTRLFHQNVKTTPMRQLTSLRMQEAKRQLQHSPQRVTDIALNCGFSSSQHLAQVCKKFYACTPLELRRGE